ncbi:YceI family protein [Carboxylicivirga taeanensis]|uniref:YceI family protein n=1 Tax=Carboxylicivirga taeanensis TaxID=1416875 RepID=UPI003F6E06CE
MKTRLFLLGLLSVLVSTTILAQKHQVDANATTVKWTGTKVIGSSHYGYIQLKEGHLNINKKQITDGQFIIDMTSMTNTDLENEEYNKKLIGHLHSDDFFSVKAYPTAQLKITDASKFKGNKATVKGELTIKGQTQPIEFEVEQKENAYMASIVVDRTLYGIRYGSGSFFDNLGDKAISNDFTLDVKLVLQ